MLASRVLAMDETSIKAGREAKGIEECEAFLLQLSSVLGYGLLKCPFSLSAPGIFDLSPFRFRLLLLRFDPPELPTEGCPHS